MGAASYLVSSPLWLGYVAASFTCFYSIRSLSLSYNANERSALLTNVLAHNNSQFILGLGSILLGFLLSSSLIMTINPIIVSNFTKILPISIGLIILIICLYKKLPNQTISFSVNKLLKKFLV